MKNICKLTLITASLFIIQGCASHTNFIKKYDSWVGQNISRLIETIGYPDSNFILPNKNTVYVYEHSRIYSIPSMIPMMGYGYGNFYSGLSLYGGYDNEIVQEICKLFIETNKKGIIIKWRSRGNNCISN